MAPTCVVGILTTALRCGTQWNVLQCDVSYVQTVEWLYLTVHLLGSDKVIHSTHEYWSKPTIGLYAAEL